ncbi:MAG TPA: FKBP-type peptidyl-prolyl cis-trans isomerase [archaeon]|nr:FKBP-type peptidyl-prolyl cis-trans isomerase [archaeon]
MKLLYLIPILLVSACIGGTAIAAGDKITVEYSLFVEGSLIDTSIGKVPFTFTVGSGQVIVGFDNAVLGMKEGEEKTFNVTPDEGYGISGSHPLAGKTLVFKIKILKIEPAAFRSGI